MGKFSSANVFFSDDKKRKIKKNENLDLFFQKRVVWGNWRALKTKKQKNKKTGRSKITFLSLQPLSVAYSDSL